MEARFAGSQRLGDRRRRRLAVEGEDAPEQPVELSQLAAGNRRHPAHSKSDESNRSASGPPPLPLHVLVPREWWKYIVAGLTGLLLIAGIGAAGWKAPEWTLATGVSFGRMFTPGQSEAASWLSAGLLGLSAQLALLVWWGRSRSLKDFNGQYRLWTWTAASWLVLSCCTALDMQRLLGDFGQAFLPAGIPRRDLWGWLIPVIGLTVWLAPALRREMSGCRGSRWLLYVAGLCYVSAAVLDVGLHLPWNELTIALVRQSTVLCGHLALVLSMWVHARYVLYVATDPQPRRARTLGIPMPHFRLPSFSFRRRTSPENLTTEAPGEAVPARKPKRERKAFVQPRSEIADPARVETADVATDEPAGEVDEPVQAVSRPPAPERRGIAVPERPAIPVQRNEPEEREAESRWRDDGSEEDTSESDRSEDDSSEVEHSFEKPNLKGLSKKQRRRLMQEIRDRERAARDR